MATKPLWAVAGTVPAEHGLDSIRKTLTDNPRGRYPAVVDLYSAGRSIATPEGEADTVTLVVYLADLEPITDPADIDQLQAMRTRARRQRPGQARMDEAEEAQAGAGEK